MSFLTEGICASPFSRPLFEALSFKSEHKVLKEHVFSLPEYYPDAEWMTHPPVYSLLDFGLETIAVLELVPDNLQKGVLSIFLRFESYRLIPTCSRPKLLTL